MVNNHKKFRILSLDGGGVRGYLSILILENIENHLNEKEGNEKPLGERFDLIAGTSTGAIIGGLLAIGKSARDIRKMYENDIPVIFGKRMRRRFPLNIFPFSLIFSKYKTNELSKKANSYFEDLTFKDVKTDLIVTSVDISSMTPRFHKSDFAEKNKWRVNEKLASAIIASSSAPSYFPIARHLKYSDYLIDGGIVANNPSLIALIDALQFERKSKRNQEKPNSISDVTLLSLGTGEIGTLPYNLKSLENTSLDWLIEPQISIMPPSFETSKPLIDILMETQSKLTEDNVKFLFKAHNNEEGYLRINPLIKSKIKLDDANKISILKNLANLTQHQINQIEKML